MLTYLKPRLSTAAKSAPLVSLTALLSVFALVGSIAIPFSGAIAEDDSATMCGDSNGDGTVSPTDALGILRFSTGAADECAPPAATAAAAPPPAQEQRRRAALLGVVASPALGIALAVDDSLGVRSWHCADGAPPRSGNGVGEIQRTWSCRCSMRAKNTSATKL